MAAIGGDAVVGEDMVAGISLTKVSNRLDFRDGGRWKADGYQLGTYGVIDRGSFYAKAMASYGWFNGDSRRIVDWSTSGGDLAGTLTGKPDARLWTVGARFGYRVPLGDTSQLTPFVNIDHSSATLEGFTETGLSEAALTVEESSSSRTAVTVGTKWAGDLGGVVPQLELGYRHLFGDRRAAFDAAFAEAPGSDFSIVSAAEKHGSFLAGASLGGQVGSFDVRVGYRGLFDGLNKFHSANFRLTLPLGGK
jgi:outer membrane autotransporter protein